MTNKPMLSVEMRALLERLLSHDFAEECQECGIGYSDAWGELRALLDKPVLESQYDGMTQDQAQAVSDGVDEILHDKPAAQHQVRPPSATHFKKSDKCPSTGGIQYYRHDGGSRWSYWPEGLNLWSSLACKPDGDIEPIICTHPAGCTSCSWCGFKAEQPAQLAVVPDGYCIMPKRLTAENGAKALLLGEFSVSITQECPECKDLDEPIECCEICDGEGEFEVKQLISWDKIKYIYSEAVKGLALNPDVASLNGVTK